MNALDIINQDGTLVVSSETIANGAGSQHASVLRLIDDRKSDFEDFGQVRFEIRPGYNNAPVRFALLNEAQATLLMTFQRNTDQVVAFKKALVKAFFEMAKQLVRPAVPQSLPDALRAYASEVEHRQALEAKAQQDAPLVAHAETFRSAEGKRTVTDVANDFKVFAANRFPGVKILQQDVFNHAGRLGLMIRGNTIRHNQPTARAIEAGWAVPARAEFETNHGTNTRIGTRLTPAGEGRLWDGMFEWINEHGSLTLPRCRS